jgi:hypothetical protein
MQDRYAGDLGDFLKFGLLRWLGRGRLGHRDLRLGIVWYLVPNEMHNADGKHVAYLDPRHRTARELRAADPDLYDRLGSVVTSGTRSVESLERAGVLARDTVTFATPLHFGDLPTTDRLARLRRRHDWVSNALDATKDCELVFVDPDNGVRLADHAYLRHRNRAEKHAYLDEIAAFADRGQSLIAYHHADRSAPVIEQARRRLGELHSSIGRAPLAAVRASRGTTRLYLISADPSHQEHLASRLRALSTSPWSNEFVVYWWTTQS